MRTKWGAVVAMLVMPLALLACGSSSNELSSGGGAHTYTIGVLADVTGPGASVNGSANLGVEAGIKLAARYGYKIKEVVADTGTNPAQVLPSAQKLVDENNVLAIVASSAVTFGAAPWLSDNEIPVLGWSEDGSEWLTSKNMFAAGGPSDPSLAATTLGKFWKMEGVTNVGVVGYGYVLSSEGAESDADSARSVGLKVGYLNDTFPLGSTNVQLLAIAMNNDGVNGFVGLLEPNASLLTMQAIRQEGIRLKAAVLFTGYGGDLEKAGPGALEDANGVYFALQFEPAELHTPATVQFQKDLRSVGVTSDPTFSEYQGYLSVDLLVQGLEKAGPNPSRAHLIAALNGIKNFNAAGLLGSHTLNIGARTPVPSGVDNCLWFTRLSGTEFQLVPGAEPLCGSLIPGVNNTGS